MRDNLHLSLASQAPIWMFNHSLYCCWEPRVLIILSTSKVIQKGIAAAKIPHIKYLEERGKHQQNVIKCLGKCQTSLRQILCKVGAISRPQIAPVVIDLGNRSPPFYLVIISTARTSAFRQIKRGKKRKMCQKHSFWAVCLLHGSVVSYASMHSQAGK